MLRVALNAADLANVRLALSPLWEVIASVRVLNDPGLHPLHQLWVKQVHKRLTESDRDWQLLFALVCDTTIPGFVSPPPAVPSPDLELELATLAATPPKEVRTALASMVGPNPPALIAVYNDPVAGLAHLVDIIGTYWDIALAPYWPSMLALLERDVHYRARTLADGGVHLLLSGLDPRVRWNGETHTLDVTTQHFSGFVELEGRGLLLVPSLFIWPRIFAKLSRPWQPTLRYPPRGIAELWHPSETSTSGALSAVLGHSRTALLTELHFPTSTTDLAMRTGLSAGNVSQHLKVLRGAGLVNAHRTGRYVLYARTSLSQSLFPETLFPETQGAEGRVTPHADNKRFPSFEQRH